MKIGIVSQWFDPEVGSAALPGVIARALRARGNEVHVVTSFPNYPTGELYPGYVQRPGVHEVRAGIDVRRAPTYLSHDRSAGRRMLSYLSFGVAAIPAALRSFRGADAVLVYSTPATAAIPALVARLLGGRRYVVFVQDLWPQTVLLSGFLSPTMTRAAAGGLNLFCDLVYRRAAHIAVSAPGMIDAIAARGVPREKLSWVANWTDEAAFRPVPADPALKAELRLTAEHIVMYAGNLGEYQALDRVVDAAALLRDRPDIGFALVGGGTMEPTLREQVARLGLTNVTFVPPQPFARMADILALGDVQLISLQDLPLFRITLPSKLQGTLAAGRPIIGAVAGDAARVITQADAGRVVQPGDVDALAAAIAAAFADPERTLRQGTNGRDYYQARLCEAIGAERLEARLALAAGLTR